MRNNLRKSELIEFLIWLAAIAVVFVSLALVFWWGS